MRKAKTLSLFAVAALAALVVAAPAAAEMDAYWTENENVLVESKAVELEGTITRSIPGVAAVSCQYTADATLIEGETGEITSFEVDPESCGVTGGLSACTIVEASAALPWSLDAVGGKSPHIAVNSVSFTWKFSNSPCPASGNSWKYTGSMKLEPDNTKAISSYTLNSETSTPISGFGTFEPAGVFGIKAAE